MAIGRTVITRAAPETTDDNHESRIRRHWRSGLREPYLARFGIPVDGEIRGRTRVTEAAPETTDDDGTVGAMRSVLASAGYVAGSHRVVGRTVSTKVAAETTDEPGG